jgi:hypothetical protein
MLIDHGGAVFLPPVGCPLINEIVKKIVFRSFFYKKIVKFYIRVVDMVKSINTHKISSIKKILPLIPYCCRTIREWWEHKINKSQKKMTNDLCCLFPS